MFKSFLSFCSSFVKSRYVFSRPVKVCRDRGLPARYGLSRMVLRFLPACHVLLGPLTFCYVVIKFCYVYQVLSRFSTMKRGRWIVFEPQCAHGIKRRSTKLLQLLYYAPLIKNIITCNSNEEADFVLYLTEPLVQILNNFSELFLIIPSTKISQMIPLRWAKGPPEL